MPGSYCVTLVIAIPARQNIPYYHMIGQDDYEAFTWIKDNVGNEYDKAILNPWEATSFTAITGKTTYSRTHTFTTEKDKQAQRFLIEGCVDTAFMKENGISLVYSEFPCNNPDLVEVRENVYLLDETRQSQ